MFRAHSISYRTIGFVGIAVVCLALARCGEPAVDLCANLTGTPWAPNVPGTGATNHTGQITLTLSSQEATGRVRGLAQGVATTDEAVFTFDMTEDLGSYGSLTMMAKVTNYPASLPGSAFAILTSLSDGTDEWVNLKRAGSGGDCVASGYFTCTSGICTANSNCTVQWPTAFTGRSHWELLQIPNSSGANSPSINTFPTCSGTGGTQGSATVPACGFTQKFFDTGNKLRFGTTYTARYAILADSLSTVSSVVNPTVQLTIAKKKSLTSTMGAVDLNVYLVGSKNVKASRTAKGQQNLDTLFARVATLLGSASGGVKLGSINAIEACSVTSSPTISGLAALFATSGTMAPAGSEGKSINTYLVESIMDSSSSGFTILGYDGAIGGPPIHGTASSGLAVSTFGLLDTHNPSCTGTGVCPNSTLTVDFNDLSEAVAHEMGHFFGLNHLSESGGTEHDPILDTPFCTTKSTGSFPVITNTSCRVTDTNAFPATGLRCNQTCTAYSASSGNYCPTAVECAFNYLMWWTTKNFTAGAATGDGNILSTEAMSRIQRSPVVQ